MDNKNADYCHDIGYQHGDRSFQLITNLSDIGDKDAVEAG